MIRINRAMIGLAVIALCGLATQLPAQAAYDNTPPNLKTPLKAHFIVGTQLDQWTVDEDYFYNVPQVINWSGSDDSGDVYYSLWDVLAGDEPQPLIDFTLETSANVLSSDYDDQYGGGSFATSNWSVQAHDFSGNSVERAVYGAFLVVTQDDGSQTTGHTTDDVAISYTGDWQTSSCLCFAAGTTHKTTAAGAAANIAINVSADEGVRKVALVMETAPNRGKARIFVDGELRTTIDTLAGSVRHQVVVWQGSLATGNHIVKVVNQATVGRPRIDLDAVVVN
jgi:hypothetical protein